MDFESATQEERELCLCGGGPMGKGKLEPVAAPVEQVVRDTPRTESKPDDNGQGELF